MSIPPKCSILILAFNLLEYTKRCLRSIRENTSDVSYELILVDNASSDGTKEYFPSLEDAKIIRHDRNLGFAAGNNSALRAATGDYVVFLNNDTVVTRGWLGKLIAHALRSPAVAMVGPRSNYVSGPQQINGVSYNDASGLEAFADKLTKENAGIAVEAERLVAFCLLVKRSVLNEIGGFDEQFETGNFEDDDLCRRATVAGYKLLIAQDVFIHHFGNRTFRENNIDWTAAMLRNLKRFEDKWGVTVTEKSDPYLASQKLAASGVQQYSAGQYLEAARSFGEAIKLFPSEASHHYNFGAALLQAGKPDAAYRSIKHSVELCPPPPDVVETFKKVAQLIGKRKEAEALLRSQKAKALTAIHGPEL